MKSLDVIVNIIGITSVLFAAAVCVILLFEAL